MNEMKTEKDNYASADGLVVIRKTKHARRWPRHDYPVVTLTLTPQPGTRVLALDGGRVEFMPRFSEIFALILQMGIKLAEEVPADKPEDRRLRFARLNARRHGRAA